MQCDSSKCVSYVHVMYRDKQSSYHMQIMVWIVKKIMIYCTNQKTSNLPVNLADFSTQHTVLSGHP
jgi:hypothetical protein